MIPYGRQEITQADIDAVVSVLRSDFLTQGPVVSQFEATVANYVGAQHSVAMNSATSALHTACLALGLGPGDWLWTSPNTFVASANCALYCGARVDFVDIDPQTYNLCADSLAVKLKEAEIQNRLPKIVMPVHFAGQSCDMATIYSLSQRYGFKIIEDASHAIGGKYREGCIGNCKYSDITVFSFHPVKIITTGEGGMALTNSATLFNNMLALRGHGITRDPDLMDKESDGGWYYQQIDLGFNYRMTDIQASLGVSQMARVNDYVEKRHALSKRYDQLLAKFPLTIPYQHQDSYSSMHLYVVRLHIGKLDRAKRQIFDELRAGGIGVNVHYIPVHMQPYYYKLGFRSHDLPNAVEYYEEAISLPLYAGMSYDQQDQVICKLKSYLK